MNKRFYSLLLLIMVNVFAFLIAGCGGNDKFEGKWVMLGDKADPNTAYIMTITKKNDVYHVDNKEVRYSYLTDAITDVQVGKKEKVRTRHNMGSFVIDQKPFIAFYQKRLKWTERNDKEYIRGNSPLVAKNGGLSNSMNSITYDEKTDRLSVRGTHLVFAKYNENEFQQWKKDTLEFHKKRFLKTPIRKLDYGRVGISKYNVIEGCEIIDNNGISFVENNIDDNFKGSALPKIGGTRQEFLDNCYDMVGRHENHPVEFKHKRYDYMDFYTLPDISTMRIDYEKNKTIVEKIVMWSDKPLKINKLKLFLPEDAKLVDYCDVVSDDVKYGEKSDTTIHSLEFASYSSPSLNNVDFRKRKNGLKDDAPEIFIYQLKFTDRGKDARYYISISCSRSIFESLDKSVDFKFLKVKENEKFIKINPYDKYKVKK